MLPNPQSRARGAVSNSLSNLTSRAQGRRVFISGLLYVRGTALAFGLLGRAAGRSPWPFPLTFGQLGWLYAAQLPNWLRWHDPGRSADSVELINWMLDACKRAGGKIVFKRGGQDSKMKEISFKEAYCVGYTESFDARGRESQASMLLGLVISANKIDVNGSSLDNHWK